MALVEAFRSNWLIATFGLLLYSFGIGLLYWNEGRAVHTSLSLGETIEDAVTIDPTEELENNYDDRVVHISGPIILGEPLTEPDYNIQILAVKLRRRVQMYQWVEESVEHNYGQSVGSVEADSRNYYYTMEWRDKLVDSRNFQSPTAHRNPDRFPIESQTQVADSVTIGMYELSDDIKNKINNFQELTSDTRPEDPSIKLHLGIYYHTNDVFNPEIGDVRILFTAAGIEGESYTIVGKLKSGNIVPYKTSQGIDVLLVYPGELGLAEVFKLEHQAQRLTTWTFRFMGWVLMFFAVTCTSTLLHIILNSSQFLAALAPNNSFPLPANFILSLSLALIIASIAWAMHRPMVGASLLFAALSPFVWCARSVANYQHLGQ